MIGQFIQRLHQGVAPERSVCNGGGSGGGSGGSGQVYYANYDKLTGAQADIATNLYNQYASYAPTYLANSADMTEQAMNGTLANQVRQQAGNDAVASMGSALDASNRNMQRYGMGMSANRMLSESNRNAILGAGLKSSAMNNATMAAEDMKWNRNANAYGQIAGMGSGAMQGLGSAGSSYGSMAQGQSALQAQNAAGMGKFGAAIGASMFKADGGYIEKPGLKLASGGMARRAPIPMQKVDWRAYPSSAVQSGGGGSSFGNTAMQIAGGVAPFAIGAGLKEYGPGAAKGAWSWMKDSLAKQLEAQQAQQGVDYTGAEAFGLQGGGANAMDWDAQNVIDEQWYNQPMAQTAQDGEYSMYEVERANGGYIQKRGLRFADGGYALPQVSSSASPESGVRRSSGSGSAGISVQQGLGLAMKGKNLLNKGTKAYNEYSQQQAVESAKASEIADATAAKSAYEAGGNYAGDAAASSYEPMATATGAPEGVTYGGDIGADGPASSGSSFFGGNWGGAAISGATNAAQAQYTPNDPDGFGNYTPDYRHAAGSGVLSYYIPYVGGMVADVLHPVAEPVSRAMVTTGDSITDSSAGAMVLDPVATTTSGKYSPEQIAMDGAKENAKIFSAASFLGGDPIGGYLGGKIADWFADGGRVNMKPGGPVRGPGTETSDDIPAWLSDGEYVINAEAVKMVGKDKLDKVNEAGLKRREARGGKKPAPAKGKGLKRAKGGAVKKGC